MIKRVHTEDVKKEFLYKLQKLMEEYKVVIYFSVSPRSDIHGLNDEKMVISSSLLTNSRFEEEIWFEQHGWGIDEYDLRS